MSSSDISSVTGQLAKASVDDGSILSFAGKGIKLDTAKDADEIVDAINSAKELKSLRLEGNTLGVEAAKVIGQALEKHPEFERALWSDMFTGRLKSEIPDALRSLGGGIMVAKGHLVELDLSDNAFGPNGMEGILDLLKSPSCYSLKELRLNNNGLGIFGGKMLADCLMECYKSSVEAGSPLALTTFVSGRGRLEDKGAIALAEVFKAMGSLEELSMPQNGIQYKGIRALADGIASCKKLRHLNLNDNIFTAEGAKAMAKALPNMQELEIINFGDCLVRTEGALAIAAALKPSHTKLKELILSFNEIKLEGGKAVVDSMENKTDLEKVELNGNQFGEDGVELIQGSMEALGKDSFLGSLSEDEGSEDEDEEENEEEEEEPEDDSEGDEVKDPELQVKGTGLTPRSEAKPVSASDFLAFPSPSKLQNLSGESSKVLIDHLGDKSKDVDSVLEAFMKVSSVVSETDEKSKEKANSVADGLFAELLASKDENIVPLFSNALLVHLGVLKSEDKTVKPPSCIAGPLIVLQHTIAQTYFPKATRDILQIFLAKSHPLLDASPKSLHELLQILYKF